MPLPVSLADVQQAQAVLRGRITATPILPAPLLAEHVYFKAENLQRAGSFKVRGALNKMQQLTPAERERGVIAASAGNHAQAVALAAQQARVPATIVMPVGAPIAKVEATERYGAHVVLHGEAVDDAYGKARELQQLGGQTFLHGFDDPAIMAGQGTIGLEIVEALPDLDTVLVPIGGGGLIGGVAAAVKALRPDARVIGVQAAGAPAVYRAKKEGVYMTTQSVRTIADGIAIKQPGRLCWELIDALVDDVVLVGEEEICEAILFLLERSRLTVEGAGAVGVAALLTGRVKLTGTTCALLSGGNIDVNILSRMIERGLVKAGRLVRIQTFVPDRPGGLQKLITTVAAAGANIMHVQHDRWLNKVTVGEVEIDLAIETRNQRHLEEVQAALAGAGYHVRVLQPLHPGEDY